MECCEENTRLNELDGCIEDELGIDKITAKCLDLFWRVVPDDSTQREGKTTKKPTLKNRFQEKNTVKIQLVTSEDGKLTSAVHNEPCLYPVRDPINPCPSDIRVFQMEDIEFLDEVWRDVFKAKIGDAMVCVKGAPRDTMLPEIEILVKITHHPSLLSPLLGVIDAGQGRIDKFTVPFIIGRQLARVREATLEQKAAWRKQISEAISLSFMTQTLLGATDRYGMS